MKNLHLYISLLFVLTCAKEDSQAPTNITPKFILTASAEEGGSVDPSTGTFIGGTQVSITATASSGYRFTGWSNGSSDNPVTITLNYDTSVTANFEQIPVYSLIISAEDGGSVSSEGGEYSEGTEVSITATPDEGYEFIFWSDGSTESTRVLTASEDLILTASFINANSSSGLPIIYINTSGVSIVSKDDYVEGSISISGSDNFPDLSETDIKIKGRGNSTWWQGGIWGKKPYQIKFDDKTQVLNMPKDKKWVLLAEISDVSLIRNKLAREISSIGSFDYVPKAEYVELLLNGQHQGTYLVGQKVEESKNRVNIGDDGYLVEIDTDANGRIDPNDDVYFKSAQSGLWPEKNVFNIKEPGLEYNSDKFNLIIKQVDDFEAALFGEDFKNPESGYRAYIDLESFIDYYLVSEITKNQDAASYSSIYFTYLPGEKIKMGPIWDYDLAFGNVNYSEAQYPEGFWIKSGNPWFKRMFEDDYFKEAVRERFNYYYSNLGSFQSKIDELQSYISAAQERNFQLYPGLLDPNVEIWPVPVRFYNHNGYVDHLKTWLTARMDWLNTNL